MVETLPAFLKRRAPRSYRYFLQQIEGVTPEDALRYRTAQWPPHEFGIGQDGSIAGIVYHVAAWKQITLPVFQPNGVILTMADFEALDKPDRDDWFGICAWLQTVGEAWNAVLEAAPDSAFATLHPWNDHPITLAQYVVEMAEHDVQHAAQLEYLRQRLLAEATPPE